jgi:hypothetical protein
MPAAALPLQRDPSVIREQDHCCIVCVNRQTILSLYNSSRRSLGLGHLACDHKAYLRTCLFAAKPYHRRSPAPDNVHYRAYEVDRPAFTTMFHNKGDSNRPCGHSRFTSTLLSLILTRTLRQWGIVSIHLRKVRVTPCSSIEPKDALSNAPPIPRNTPRANSFWLKLPSIFWTRAA